MRLKDAQQAQALAEHNSEQLARELNCAREKVTANKKKRGEKKGKFCMQLGEVCQAADAEVTLELKARPV